MTERHESESFPVQPQQPTLKYAGLQEGEMTVGQLLKRNNITRDIYKQQVFGDGIVLPTSRMFRNSPVLSQDEQQQMQEKIDEYWKRRRESGGRVKPRLHEGSLHTREFLRSQNIPIRENSTLTGDLAEKRGLNFISVLSPNDQELIKKRWKEILNAREQERLASIPLFGDITNIISQIANLDPGTLKELYLAKDSNTRRKISTTVNSLLTSIERKVILVVLEGVSDMEIAERLNMDEKQVAIVKQIALERLNMDTATSRKPQSSENGVSSEESDELEGFTLEDLRAIEQKLQFLPREPFVSWTRTAQILGVSPFVLKIFAYLGSVEDGQMSYGVFSDNLSEESIPSWKLKVLLEKVHQTMLRTYSLKRAFTDAHPRNDIWTRRQKIHEAPFRRREPLSGRKKIRLSDAG